MTSSLRHTAAFVLLVVGATTLSCSPPSDIPPLPTSTGYSVARAVQWAKPDGQSLTMDIYTPGTGKSSYPVLIIYHGGGWLLNSNRVMDSMSTYIVRHSEYVVCNVNYRLLGDNANTVTMNEMIEDAMGAVVWIKEFIARYKGDPARLILTGDSAGGHLAAMVLLSGDKLGSNGFNDSCLTFKPTFLPAGKSAEDLAREHRLSVQGAILSYPALDIYTPCLYGFESSANYFWSMAGQTPRGIFGNAFTVQRNPKMYKAVSPVYIIPPVSERSLPPQLCIVGSADNIISPASVQAYVQQVRNAGHLAEYWEHAGRPHAFLDSGKNYFMGTEFCKDAPPALDKMIEFMNGIFYATPH